MNEQWLPFVLDLDVVLLLVVLDVGHVLALGVGERGHGGALEVQVVDLVRLVVVAGQDAGA